MEPLRYLSLPRLTLIPKVTTAMTTTSAPERACVLYKSILFDPVFLNAFTVMCLLCNPCMRVCVQINLV